MTTPISVANDNWMPYAGQKYLIRLNGELLKVEVKTVYGKSKTVVVMELGGDSRRFSCGIAVFKSSIVEQGSA